jgi:hypothetical protein
MHKLALLQANRHDLLSKEQESIPQSLPISNADVTIVQIPLFEPLQMH